MRDMAVHQPATWLARGPDDVVPLAGADIHGVGLELGIRRQIHPIAGDHGERATMNMHRVHEIGVATDETYLDRFAEAHLYRVGGRISLAVDREIVGQTTFHVHCRISDAVTHEPFLQQEGVLVIGFHFFRWISRGRCLFGWQIQCGETLEVVRVMGGVHDQCTI